MKTVEMKLLKHQNHIGHCQLTYTSKNDLGQRLVYCLQDQGENFGGIRLLRCTQECEPCHEVKFTEVRAVFEKPQPVEYDSEYALNLKRLCVDWIENYERGFDK